MRKTCLIALIAPVILPLCACTSTGATRRDRPFTREWAEQVRTETRVREQGLDPAHRNTTLREGVNVQSDEKGRPGVTVGGKQGVGLDLGGARRGGLRFRRDWDFVKPERSR